MYGIDPPHRLPSSQTPGLVTPNIPAGIASAAAATAVSSGLNTAFKSGAFTAAVSSSTGLGVPNMAPAATVVVYSEAPPPPPPAGEAV